MPTKTAPPPTDLITLDELCEMGRMGKEAYRHLRRQGRAPSGFKIGRRLYFERRVAEAWMRNVRMVPTD
jgi:hypothetical protein